MVLIFQSTGQVLVLNKVDIKTSKKFSDNKIYKPIKISVKKNIGISKLIDEISKKIADHFKVNEDNIISRQRHVKSLENTVFFIEKCLKKNSINQIDLAAEDIRLAVRNLGEIFGCVNVEELLDKIFKDFCIGK